MKTRSRTELHFDGADYISKPYDLVRLLVSTPLDADPSSNHTKILPLLDNDKRSKRLLLESITKNAKAFYELVQSSVNDGKLNWNERANLLAYLFSSQRRVKSTKRFGSTKSSVELQRIVMAMYQLGDVMNKIEVLNQPAALYDRKVKSSHRGMPYLDRAESYITLGYFVRAQLDIMIAQQYKKCDQTKLTGVMSRLIQCQNQDKSPVEEMLKLEPAQYSFALNEGYQEPSSKEEGETSSTLFSCDNQSGDLKHSKSAQDLGQLDNQNELSMIPRIEYPDDALKLQPIKVMDARPAPSSPEVSKPIILADELAFRESLETWKADFMAYQLGPKRDLKPLRKLIQWLERPDIELCVVRKEMLVCGKLRSEPDLNDNQNPYEEGSLLAYLCGQNHLVELSECYGVMHILRLLKALPSWSRFELAEKCCDPEEEMGRQFLVCDGDSEERVTTKQALLDKIKSCMKKDAGLKPWDRPSLFSSAALPELFPKENVTAKDMMVEAVMTQLTRLGYKQ